MMLKKYHALVLASVLGIGTLAMAGGGASAAAITPVQQYTVDGSELLQVVNHRRGHNTRRYWNRRVHGDRCRTRFGNCRHYYRGYYYRTPWWGIAAVPLIIGGAVVAGSGHGGSHVEWCLNRYRSYNPRTNTYVTYNGERRQCRSPY